MQRCIDRIGNGLTVHVYSVDQNSFLLPPLTCTNKCVLTRVWNLPYKCGRHSAYPEEVGHASFLVRERSIAAIARLHRH